MGAVNLSKHTVNLSKGEKVNLSKKSEGLKKIMVALGWDPVTADSYKKNDSEQPKKVGFFQRLYGKSSGSSTQSIFTRQQDIDCDAWVCLLKDGKYNGSKKDLIAYFNLRYGDVITHHGDNLTGDGEGDDEQITIDLSRLPSEYNGIVVGVTVYEGKNRNQSFDNINNTFIRVVDERDNFEICRFNQKEMSDGNRALTFIAGKLYKDKGEWHFEAVGKCTMDDTITQAANHYRYEH